MDGVFKAHASLTNSDNSRGDRYRLAGHLKAPFPRLLT